LPRKLIQSVTLKEQDVENFASGAHADPADDLKAHAPGQSAVEHF